MSRNRQRFTGIVFLVFGTIMEILGVIPALTGSAVNPRFLWGGVPLLILGVASLLASRKPPAA